MTLSSSMVSSHRADDVLDLIHHHQTLEVLDASLATLDLSTADHWPADAQRKLVQRMETRALLEAQFRHLLTHDRLDVGLHQAVRDGWLTPQDGQALWRRGLAYLQDHERSDDGVQINLLVLSLMGERGRMAAIQDEVRAAAVADLQAWAQAHQMNLAAHVFPQPIHPLLWATLSSGEQHRLVQGMADGQWPDEAQRLLDAHHQRTQNDSTGEAHVEPLIVPIVVVAHPMADGSAVDDPAALTPDLLDIKQDEQLWAHTRAVEPGDVQVTPPLPLTVGLTETLVDFMCLSRDLLAVLHGVPANRWSDVQPDAPIERPEGLGLPLQFQGDAVGELVLHAGWFTITEPEAMGQVWEALARPDAPFPGLEEVLDPPSAGAPNAPGPRYH